MRCVQVPLLMLCLWCLSMTSCNGRSLFRRRSSYNTFMKKMTLNFEKAKVETLGAIFKRHVQQLRNTPNKQVELVFLIDSSGTVGKYYFFEELRFVKNLLADFTVDVNSTRVSVITFSSPHKVFRYIDYLSHPAKDFHKCRLLNDDMPDVSYTPGGTHTLGALLEAEKVLRSARPEAAKAIFLMTDGYSNGGDPRPVAWKLKRQGVKIFTFGIRDGFVWELQDMASDPKNETCYILDSFEEFEALAKRALHEDLQSGSYIPQEMTKCGRLCRSDGMACCHENATCSCGTYTGKYECLCLPGFYGTGRGKTGCKPCPPGTYKNITGQGNIQVCTPCPDQHQTTPLGADSESMCHCKRGYRSFGSRECTVFRCNELSPPKYGYFVNKKCNNVFNAACGLRCQHGYELRGSSLRICQEDGTWSGQDAQCIMKTCPSLPAPKNGHMICSSDDFSYSSVCRFTCNAGYQLVGSRKRTCLAIAFWTGIVTRCREIMCPPLVQIKDGTIHPPSCTAKEVVFGSTCVISCSSGYSLKGPHTKQCTPDGTWMAVEAGANKCVDETPPVLHCPENKEVTADAQEVTTQVNWTVPVPVDNSGFRPTLTSDPAVTSGSRFPIGETVVTYRAEDLSQNVAKCEFSIKVIDKTPPGIDSCVSPPPTVSRHGSAEVTLEPPQFSDNSGRPVEIAVSHNSGTSFPLGTTQVTYTAFDRANNRAECVLDVSVIAHLCVIPEPPVNGDATCDENRSSITCRATCKEGHAFAMPPADEYHCDYSNGTWFPRELFPFPDCAVVQRSNDILQPATITLTGDLSCQDRLLLNRIEQNLEGRLQDKISTACKDELNCSVGSLTSVCEDEQDFNKIPVLFERRRRRRRSIREYSEQARERRTFSGQRSRIAFDMMLQGRLRKSYNSKSGDPEQLSKSLRDMMTSLQREARNGNLDLRVAGRTLTFSQMSYDMDHLTYRCPEGSVLVNTSCVNCPMGTFFNVMSERCQDCPKGTYQPREGSNTCLRCPDNKSTDKQHARDLRDCKALCLPGTSSPTGLTPCVTCHLGFYQTDYAARFCEPCPVGMTTFRRGARREENCASPCPPGHASETGLTPCMPCPRSSYQPKRGQSECLRCPAQGSTLQHGATSLTDCIIPAESRELQSDVDVSLGDEFQESLKVPFNPCFQEPCENEGTCISEGVLFSCICPPGFLGNTCEEVVNLCDANPCLNGGFCEPIPGAFQCYCQEGFSGEICEEDKNDCASSPCENEGVCVDGINTFNCLCKPGFSGLTCAAASDQCEDNPCRHGGTCVSQGSGFTCECPPGSEGMTCEMDVDECLEGPCLNGATCQDTEGSFRCDCARGYEGPTCAGEVNECALEPCENGATCEDLIGDYSCTCVTGYTGKKCEKELTSQYQLDFTTPTIVDYAQLSIKEPLNSVTVSFWMRSDDEANQGTPFSYAVHGEPNALTVTDYKNLNLIINGETKSIGFALNDGQWHHVVLTWSSYRGDWKAYVDGLLRDQGYNLSTLKPIPGKGSFIVGQKQDTLGGGFSPSETFVGSITQLNVWDEELPLSDIEKLRFSCSGFYGNVIAWPDVQEALSGDVTRVASSFCQGFRLDYMRGWPRTFHDYVFA